MAWLLLLWLLDDLDCCYFEFAGKNGDDAGKNGRRRKKWRRRNGSIDISGIDEILYLVPTSLYCYPCREIKNAILNFTIEF